MLRLSHLGKKRIILALFTLIVLCMGGGYKVEAAEFSPLPLNDGSVFPNATFRSHLKEYDEDNNGYLSEAEALSITELRDTGWFGWVETFEGIQYFKNLQTLVINDCSNFLNIDFSKNPELRYVSLGGVMEHELDFSGCPELESLHISTNNEYEYVESLNVTGCTKLEHLICRCNYMGRLQKLEGIETCASLVDLDLSNNDYAGSLDLNGMKYLKYLTAYGNHWNSVNLKGCTSLTNANFDYYGKALDLSECISMEDLTIKSDTVQDINFAESLSGVSKITSFYLGSYKESELNYEPVDLTLCNIDLSDLPELKRLSIAGRYLENFDLGYWPDMTTAAFYNCRFDNLDVTGCPKLYDLQIYASRLKTLDISNCPILCDTVKNGYYNGSNPWHNYFSNDGQLVYDKSIKLTYDEGVIEGESEPEQIVIENAKVVLSATSYTFDGRIHFPTIKTIAGLTLLQGTDYSVKWSKANSWEPGTYTVTVTGKGKYKGVTKATYMIKKAVNPLTVKVKSVNLKYKKVKKKTQTIKSISAFAISKNQGALSYTKMTGNKKITINKKTGKITVKKGLKKGTYRVIIKVRASGNAHFKASEIPVKVTIKIK